MAFDAPDGDHYRRLMDEIQSELSRLPPIWSPLGRCHRPRHLLSLFHQERTICILDERAVGLVSG